MRDPGRIRPFLNRLAKIWETYPDIRFAQLVSLMDGHFYTEDDHWIVFLEDVVHDLQKESVPLKSKEAVNSDEKLARVFKE